MINPVREAADAVAAVPVIAREGAAFARSLRTGRSWLDQPLPALPRGYVDHVPGAGQLFWRDTGTRAGQRGTVLLLHGWMIPSDLHWTNLFAPLTAAGWRAVAVDARGHGRGMRPGGPFRLVDCASDAAALVRHLDCGPVIALGYSMGGPIAQLLAREHPDAVAGLVLCATAAQFRTTVLHRAAWSGMSLWQFWLRMAPRWSWDLALRLAGPANPETADWTIGEMRRGAAWDLAEAGRDVGRFDSREWLGELRGPAAVLVMSQDLLVPPSGQRRLAELLGAPAIEIESNHLAPATTPGRFNGGVLEALDLVSAAGEEREGGPVDEPAVTRLRGRSA
jgi:pimeloyl-ACP methyl ester carboxylesterase